MNDDKWLYKFYETEDEILEFIEWCNKRYSYTLIVGGTFT